MAETLWDRHAAVAQRRGDQPAVIEADGSETTHAELSAAAARAAGGLPDLGVAPGSCIGAFFPNRTPWVVLALAAARLGCGVVGLNTRFRETELSHLLGVAEVDTVLVPDSFLGVDPAALFGALDRDVRLVVDGDLGRFGPDAVPWSDIAAADKRVATGALDHPIIGFTTSGTTGFPKIAMHTQRQLLTHAGNVIHAFEYGEGTVSLVMLPMCGAFGYTVAIPTLLAGGTVVLQDVWDAGVAVRLMAEHGVTQCSGGDSMLIEIAEHPDFATVSTWTDGVYGDFTNAARQAVETVEHRSGGRTHLTGVYGSSEGFAKMCRWPPTATVDDRIRNGGYLVSADMHVRAVDPETGATLAHGDQGELHFQGPNLILEYLNNPSATAKAFGDDGWYRSGDLGYTVEPDGRGREGFVYLARLGDSLRLRGFLCDPAEIEHHLEAHGAVDLAQVVGVQMPGVGDVAVAFVHPIAEVDEATLVAHCRDGLANYKVPERIVFVDEFPVTEGPNGVKIRKVDLRAQAETLLG